MRKQRLVFGSILLLVFGISAYTFGQAIKLGDAPRPQADFYNRRIRIQNVGPTGTTNKDAVAMISTNSSSNFFIGYTLDTYGSNTFSTTTIWYFVTGTISNRPGF